MRKALLESELELIESAIKKAIDALDLHDESGRDIDEQHAVEEDAWDTLHSALYVLNGETI